MKKILFALLTFCFFPSVYAAYGSIIYSDNKDEDNVIRLISGVQDIYDRSNSFKNLEKFPLQTFWYGTTEKIEPEDTKKFGLTTEHNNQTAVIKYKVKDCNEIKGLKEKLVRYKILEDSDYVNCSNNEFAAWINKKEVEYSEDVDYFDEEPEDIEAREKEFEEGND